uniref:Uncharacterized protein n=1 Tax=Leersia perrieri TaxID=77586 RepID=A0A0D9XG35_9ORYZ
MASSRVALVCLLGLLVAASPASIAADKIFYQIAFMWPGAYCAQTKSGCCMPKTDVVPAGDFYVAGFTVYDAATNYAETGCNDIPFNINQLGDTTKLMQYWNNIKCPSTTGQKSWKNAWETSGVCSNLTESVYFETALALRDKINPLSRLPDFGLYSVEKIKKTIQKGTGTTPLIQCSKGPFNKFQLYQIFVCVAEDTKTFIECPPPKKPYTCSDEILFHPFKKWMLNTTTKSYAAKAIDQFIEMTLEI